MTYRISRHLTSSTFRVNNQFCKVVLEPVEEYRPGYWLWNFGLAVGDSRRQLNDWYYRKQNKRRRSLDARLTGRGGMKAFSKGVRTMFKLRWALQPGDVLVGDCTSSDPEKQFRSYWYWLRRHPEWVIDFEEKKIFWYRPPYVDDPIRQQFAIRAIVPEDPLANTFAERYYDCFRVEPKVPGTDLSMEQTLGLLGQVLNS
jgi:hypothetical protein